MSRLPALKPSRLPIDVEEYRSLDHRTPGYFAIRLIRHHRWLAMRRQGQVQELYQPWVPALIFSPCPFIFPDETDYPYHPEWFAEPLDRSPYPLAAKIGERLYWSEAVVGEIWVWGARITEQAYVYLMARRAWARRWFPASFEGRPTVVMNVTREQIW